MSHIVTQSLYLLSAIYLVVALTKWSFVSIHHYCLDFTNFIRFMLGSDITVIVMSLAIVGNYCFVADTILYIFTSSFGTVFVTLKMYH